MNGLMKMFKKPRMKTLKVTPVEYASTQTTHTTTLQHAAYQAWMSSGSVTSYPDMMFTAQSTIIPYDSPTYDECNFDEEVI